MSQDQSQKSDGTTKKYPDAGSSSSDQPGKVSDVVTYAYAPNKAGVPKQHLIASLPASKEVRQFALKNDLTMALEIAVKIVRESFHRIKSIRFDYDVDPEIENESWITIWVKASGSMDELLSEQSAYRKAIIQKIPINKLPFIRVLLGVD